MLLNERIRAVRTHRKLKGKELAARANISAGEVSLLEQRMRTPHIDTLQRVASALEVSTSFLLGEEDSDLPLAAALVRQSLKLFLRDNHILDVEAEYLQRVCGLESAPDTIRGWKNLLANLAVR